MISPDPDAEVADHPALFRFDAVTVDLDGVRALDGVSLSLPDHGVTVVVGASGSGKSTLLRLCNRLEVPSTGHIDYRGRPLHALDPRRLRREVGMVFQRPVVFPGTVRDNLLIAAPDRDDHALTTALVRAALDPSLLDRDASGLSGGEAQRLGLARTLLTDPRVLLLDEPTSALDAAPKRGFEHTVRELSEQGTPALWVSHELAQVHRMADRLVVLEQGRVALLLDDPTHLDDDPAVSRLLAPEADDGSR